VLLGLPAAGRVQGQQTPAPILGKTGDNLASGNAQWDLGSTDVTYKETLKQVWVLDSFSGPVPTIKTFNGEDLDDAPGTVLLTLPAEFQQAPVLGIAEIPHGDFRGKNLILIDPNFGASAAPSPLVGIFDDQGNLDPTAPFVQVVGLAEGAVLTAIDVNPEREQIVAYDVRNHQAYILDFGFTVESGPLDLLGGAHFFWDAWFLGSASRDNMHAGAGGVAFNGPNSLLVLSAFINVFEAHFVLEYDLAGSYTARAIDLSEAAGGGLDLEFAGMDTGAIGAEEAVFALNLANESVFGFRALLQPHPVPATLTACDVIAETGQYTLSWQGLTPEAADSFVIIENGVEVATLPQNATSYLSPAPLLGKAFLEVGVVKGGFLGGPRLVCQLENTRRVGLTGVDNDATQIENLGTLFGVAVTKRPATEADFRAYVVGSDTNNVLILDHRLMGLETLQLNPQVVSQGTNLAALGVALIESAGDDELVVIDPDGPQNNNIPSAGFYPVEGLNRGQRSREVNPVDLAALTPRPFLFDWDVNPTGGFVAAGIAPGTVQGQVEYVIVRLDSDEAGIRAVEMVPIPQRSLTPFATGLIGNCLSVLPSGNLLIAGGDTFAGTYTEALLTTPFTSNPATSVKPIGFAQGLVVLNQFPPFNFGPHLGPPEIYGLDVAFFPPEGARTEGIGVTYLTANDIRVITNPSLNQQISFGLNLLIHGETDAGAPDLVAEQLADTVLEAAAGAEVTTGVLRPALTPTSTIDYFYIVSNQSTDAAASAEVKLLLDGVEFAEGGVTADLPAGRYVRRAVPGRTERSVEVRVRNPGTGPASFKVIAGAMALGSSGGGMLFRRGDCDGTGANPQLTDAIFGLNYLFQSGRSPTCLDACDSDDNGQVNLTDMIFVLNYLFASGRQPPAPGPITCGPDGTEDEMVSCAYPQDACTG
jgi:hypothetical protein